MLQRQHSRPQGSQVSYGQQQDPNQGYFAGGGNNNFGSSEGIHIPRAGSVQQGIPGGLQRQQSFVGNYQASLPQRDNYASKSNCRFDSATILDIVKVIMAEFLGSFTLLFIGCSGFVFMPITFGIAIAIATQIFGDISGAHINPAVTIAAMIMGQINNYVLVPFYIVAQVAGAFVGFGLHFVIMADGVAGVQGFCITQPMNAFVEIPEQFRYGLAQIGNLFGFEFLMSILYIMAVCSLWDRNNDRGMSMPLKRGMFYTGIVLCMYIGISMPLSLNSLRALVPLVYSTSDDATISSELWSNHWDAHWIYWVAPNLGAVIGAGLYRILKFIHNKSIKYSQ